MRVIIMWLKRHFNKRFPYYRRCMCKTFCIAGQTYDYACPRHQETSHPKDKDR